MIRIVRLSHKYYGLDVGEIDRYGDLDDFLETHIDGFINSGDPVLLVNDIDDIKYFIPGFDEEDLEMVKG